MFFFFPFWPFIKQWPTVYSRNNVMYSIFMFLLYFFNHFPPPPVTRVPCSSRSSTATQLRELFIYEGFVRKFHAICEVVFECQKNRISLLVYLSCPVLHCLTRFSLCGGIFVIRFEARPSIESKKENMYDISIKMSWIIK